MNLLTRFFGGLPGLVLALVSLIIAFIRVNDVAICSVALILNVLVARLVHRQTLQPGLPAGSFRSMFTAAGYTAVAAALYLNRVQLPFGGCFKSFSPIVVPFIFLAILGVHWVNRRLHDAALAGFPTKGDRWLAEPAHVAEVERGFICFGVTGTLWTLVLSAWVTKFMQLSQVNALGFLDSSLHLAALYALYLLPWFCFAWWVGEPAVKRGIYAGSGISLAAAPLAYHCYYHSLSSGDWWQIFLPPGSHLAAITFFVTTAFFFWWVRPTASTRGSGILSGFYLAIIPTILLLPGIYMILAWHPLFRDAFVQAPNVSALLSRFYPLISKIILFSPVPILLVFLAATFGGTRSAQISGEQATQVPGSTTVAAAGSQTFTILLGLLLPLPFLTNLLTQLFAFSTTSAGAHYIPAYILSAAAFFPLLFADVFVFAGLWSAGAFIARASRLPHPQMAGAALFLLQAVLIWGYDPRQKLVALFAAILAALLILKKMFGETIDESRRSMLDFQRYVLWSCFLGMPVLFLTSFSVLSFFIHSEQLGSLGKLFAPATRPLGLQSLGGLLHPEAFWASYPALTAAIGLVFLLGLPLICVPLYLYPMFKDQKAAESVLPNTPPPASDA
ncbi:MAG TPA: hypothetical protein VIV61_15975 [Candidatus Ozemobacteraceae bacterium]